MSSKQNDQHVLIPNDSGVFGDGACISHDNLLDKSCDFESVSKNNGNSESTPLKPNGLYKVCIPRDHGSTSSAVDSEKLTEIQCSLDKKCNGNNYADGENGPVTEMSWSTLPRRSKYTLLLCSLGSFFSGAEIYFMVSYFPMEAQTRGVSNSEVGVMLAIFYIFLFSTSPLYGNYMSVIGVRFMYMSSAFIVGTSTVLFGLVYLVKSHDQFIGLCMACRSVTAIGTAGFVTAGFAILTNEFPKYAATVFGIAEVANGLGYTISPAIGGGLYQMGGFIAPSSIIGGLVMLNGFFLYLALPSIKVPQIKRQGSMFGLFRSPLFIVAVINVFVSTIGISFVTPSLGVRLESFHMSAGSIGLFYLVLSCPYTLLSPVAGYLSDVKGIPAITMVTGTLLLSSGCFILGPSPGLSFLPDNLWTVAIGVLLIGIGYCAASIPVIKLMILGAVEKGFPDNIDTYGLLSGSFYSAMMGGSFVGNTLSGILVDLCGFQVTAMIFGLLTLVTSMATILYFFVRRMRIKERQHQEIT